MRRDPTTFVLWFSMWAILCGVSLTLPNHLFKTVPLYDVMQRVYPHEEVWGWVMIADGVLLFTSPLAPSVAYRSAVAGVSAMLWVFCGMLMSLGGWYQGYFSVIGSFSLWGAIGCFFTVTQWVHNATD